ncbi:cell wall-binding repeat-containing protein [Kineococcus auxinigenes]|uniref:cell wall-binding repeat-containing protein n=1 Tax=unclassified Kineococcus TaxID=2621656 RepID=UPI003D7C44A5
MTAATSRLRRRGIGAGVAALVGLTTVGFSATSASAAPNFEITRPAQVADRFETAASVALAAFPNGAENVIVANGDNAVDALAASVLAGTDIPILYVTSNEVPAATVAALEQLDPSTSWIVGGSAAVSAAVEGELPGTIERIDGATRYETAAALAQTVVDNADTAPTSVFLARGDDFADALAIAPYAAKSGTPVLLTETGALSEAAAAFLAENEITEVTVLGGTAAVSEAVVEELEANDVTVERIRGANRQATAVDIANTEAFGFSNTGVALVNGWRPVDALPASVWAAQQNFPIILTAGAELGAAAQGYLAANAETLVTGLAIGGTGAIPASVVEAAETAAGAVEAPATNQTLTVTPAEATTLVLADEDGDTPTADDRTYTVTGLAADEDYRITLVDADSITDEDGQISFTEDGTTGLAAPGLLAADITVVNGAPTGADVDSTDTAAGATGDVQSVGGLSAVNGQITFRVDGAVDESVVPVVYVDGGENTRLELDDDGLPTEAFGVGGAVNYNPTEAATGDDLASSAVGEVDAEGDSFVAGGFSFTYDANDTFTIDAAQATFAQFEAALQEGDTVVVTDYQQDADLRSTFALTNTTEAAPVIASVEAAETTALLNISGVADDASVTVYYAEDTVSGAGVQAFVADDFTAVEVAADEDEDESLFQATVTGLEASTDYAFYVSQTTDRGESPVSTAGGEDSTTAAAGDVAIESAVVNEVNNGAGQSSTIVLTFSEDVTLAATDGTGFEVSPTSQPALNLAVTGAAVSGDTVTLTLAAPLDDTTPDTTYQVTVAAGAVNEVATGTAPNAELTATVAY